MTEEVIIDAAVREKQKLVCFRGGEGERGEGRGRGGERERDASVGSEEVGANEYM